MQKMCKKKKMLDIQHGVLETRLKLGKHRVRHPEKRCERIGVRVVSVF